MYGYKIRSHCLAFCRGVRLVPGSSWSEAAEANHAPVITAAVPQCQVQVRFLDQAHPFYGCVVLTSNVTRLEKISGIVPAEFESTVTADWLGSKKQDPNFGQENWALYA